MSNLNQYKLVKKKSELYFNIMEKSLGRKIILNKQSDRPRFGFYLYMLECLTNVKDTSEIIDMITDKDFNNTVFNDPSDDCGIDAVYIDEEERVMKLFNFKYRETFKESKKQSKNDVFISTKFTSAIINEKYTHLEGKLKIEAKEIIQRNKSNEIWKLVLYMVSNEDEGFDRESKDIDQLKGMYDLEVKSIALPEISNFMSIRPEPICAKLVLEQESVLSYTESSLISSKSYLLKIPISELIRITCNDKEYRDKYNIEDIQPLTTKQLDLAVLFDNVRGFLGDTNKYNKNILKTLKKEPTKFFMYNNGITITSEDIVAKPINAKKKLLFEIKNFQVVNGGQTLRTVHNFNQKNKDNLESILCDAEILIRIFKTENEQQLTSKIAEYTNSQSAISAIDLKSIAIEQMQIEQFLNNENIIYGRKIGDTGISSDKEYDNKISLEKFAQILFSKHGYPEKVSNQKKKIFEKYYDLTFGEENFDISESANIVRNYWKIKSVYESNENPYESSDQKIFYIIYLDQYANNDVNENIRILEENLKEYKKGMLESRKLIQNGFKEHLNEKCGIKSEMYKFKV